MLLFQPVALPQTDAQRTITRCSFDGVEFGLDDAPRSVFVAYIDDVTMHGRYLPNSESRTVFNLTRNGKPLGTIHISDMNNPNGWLAISPNRKAFALTWSDGGAMGGFHTRIFHFDPNGSLVEDSKLIQPVIKDFTARHSCKYRGDNFEAIRWMNDDQILISASVYGTSDCGVEMGYAEGYLVQMSTGKIVRRMNKEQLLNLPEVCTWNVSK